MRTLGMPQKIFLGIGAGCIVVTAIVVALINPLWTPMSIVSFLGLIWAEAILFGGLYFLGSQAPEGSSVFLRIGGSFVIIAGAVTSFIVSMIFFPMPMIMIPGFFGIQIALLVGIVIIVLIIFFLEKRFRASDEKAKEGISYIAQRSAQVAACARECTDPELRKRLERCADDLKFMDTTVRVQADSDIDSKVQAIQADISVYNSKESDAAQAHASLASDLNGLELAIASRKDEAALSKRGGF